MGRRIFFAKYHYSDKSSSMSWVGGGGAARRAEMKPACDTLTRKTEGKRSLIRPTRKLGGGITVGPKATCRKVADYSNLDPRVGGVGGILANT